MVVNKGGNYKRKDSEKLVIPCDLEKFLGWVMVLAIRGKMY